MVMVRVPGSDRFVFLPDHTGDVILDLSDYSELDDTLQNEDVVVIGDWEDYTGTGEANKGEVPLQGIEDIDPSSPRGQLEGGEIERTDRGNRTSTHRQRAKLITVET
ncbi:hypothetical protein KAI04_04825 [Candidatus Pacearchaeota archaeon]|nr:hypothetical protein [Candidatus Pacearchaeota archaeon]